MDSDNKQTTSRFLVWLVTITIILALWVIVLGAYTRLVDAGLGCPDWPVCYGQIIVPDSAQQIQQAEIAFPDRPVEQTKAWTEMVHRYFASTLGFLIVIIAAVAIKRRKIPAQPLLLPLCLVALVVFQGALGMWTVTLLLQPTIVMAHLLGGYAIFSLLCILLLQLCHCRCSSSLALKRYRFWALLGLCLLIIQIILGAWTSTNYAGVSCPDFPYCQGKLIPHFDFQHAFNFWPSIGPDYEGGLLSNTARMTINTMHRFMAVIVGIYFIFLALIIGRKAQSRYMKALAHSVLTLVFVQILLGILNVVYNLPLPLAVMHNGVGALLLASVATLVYSLYSKTESQ